MRSGLHPAGWEPALRPLAAEQGASGRDLLVPERGEGAYLLDAQGRRYLDGISTDFTVQIGHSYGQEIGARLAANADVGAGHGLTDRLATELLEVAPRGLDRVVFTSGSNSVEAAWALACEYHAAGGEPDRRLVIARERADHGEALPAARPGGAAPRSLVQAIPAERVSNTDSFRSRLTDGQLSSSLLAQLERRIGDTGRGNIAMVVMEPIQNAGGCLYPPDGYWPAVREMCDRHGVLLAVDESVCGFGRLGPWYGTELLAVRPDLVLLGGVVTSGHAPLGAVLVHERVSERLLAGGPAAAVSARGVHPAVAAIGLANLEILRRDRVLENVARLSPYLAGRLAEQVLPLPLVGDVRGGGFLWAAELVKDREGAAFEPDELARLVDHVLPGRLLEAGLIAAVDDPGVPVVHVAPPLISDEAVIDELVGKLCEALARAATDMGVTG